MDVYKALQKIHWRAFLFTFAIFIGICGLVASALWGSARASETIQPEGWLAIGASVFICMLGVIVLMFGLYNFLKKEWKKAPPSRSGF